MFLSETKTKRAWELLEATDVTITLIVVMVSHLYAYFQIHQVVDTKSVQFLVYQLYLNEMFLNDIKIFRNFDGKKYVEKNKREEACGILDSGDRDTILNRMTRDSLVEKFMLG